MSSGNNHLPETWVKVRLADIVKPTRPKHSPQEFPTLQFIGMENIEAHTMKLLGTVPASSMRSNAVHFQPGDVLYGRLRPYLNKVYCPDFEGLCSAEFIVFPPRDWIESKFLQYFLNSSGFVSFAAHLNAGDRPRVDFDQIGEYQIPLVPVHEQKRIVAEIEKQFTRLDAAVAALKRVQANLKRYRAAVLKAACEGRLVPTEAELARRESRSYEPASVLLERILAEKEKIASKIGRSDSNLPHADAGKLDVNTPKLPSGWIWTNLSELKLFSLYGPRFSREQYSAEGVPVVRTTDIDQHGKISLQNAPRIKLSDEETGRYRLATGDLVITRTGSLGTLAIFEDSSIAIPGAFLIQYRLSSSIETVKYLYFFLKSPDGYRQLVKGGAGVGRPNINARTIDSIPIPFPPQAEQTRILAEIDRYSSFINELDFAFETNFRRAERLRQSILKSAFEGKLVPQDPNDEPANILLERIRGTAIPGCAPLPSKRITRSRRALASKETANV